MSLNSHFEKMDLPSHRTTISFDSAPSLVTTKSFDRPIPPSSTTFQTPIRILNCLLEGADVPFSIDMDASQLSYINVNHLKKKILKETKNLLQDVDAHQLVLWRIDIADEEGIENYSPKHYISDGIRKL